MSIILIGEKAYDLEATGMADGATRRGLTLRINDRPGFWTEDELASAASKDVVAAIAGLEPFTARVMDAAPNLKVVSRIGVGLDSVDLAAAAARGVAVRNTPDAPVDGVAEFTLGMALALARRLAEADRDLRAGAWRPLRGRLIGAAQVGVLGYGRIGRRVATLMAALGAQVAFSDPAADAADRGVAKRTFEQLLAESDIVCVHVPGGTQTRHLLDAAAFDRMKPGALLVNVARGGVVDEAALYDRLKDGRLGGAAIDVFEQEPYDGPLARLPNVVATPHIASNAAETRARMEREAAENLFAVLDGAS